MDLPVPDPWQPDAYARHAGFVPELGRPVVELLAPQPGERILDLGCGDGVLTMALLQSGARVVGVDASPAQVAAAVARGADACVMRAESLGFGETFDAVFSNAALHWMKEMAAVLRTVARVLRPGGRFVGELGAAGNIAAIQQALHQALRRRGYEPDLYNPWHFPTAHAYDALLTGHGFQVTHLERIVRPTLLPTDIAGWLHTFAGSYLAALPEAEWQPLIAEVRDILAPVLKDSTGRWIADYVRLRFAARKQSFTA